jgi:hypothetical protein
MRNFLWGIIVGILLVPATFLALAATGRLPVVATEEPPRWEQAFLQLALEKALSRQVPELKNPTAPTEENLLAGMKIFRDGCAGCHGEADKKSAGERRNSIHASRNLDLSRPRSARHKSSGSSKTGFVTRGWEGMEE